MNKVRQLAQGFKPEHYIINLHLDRQNRYFKGEETIRGDVLTPSTSLRIHAKEIEITTATINNLAATISFDENDELILTATETFKGQVQIQLQFEGKITDTLHGLYPCYYEHNGEKKELLATQFESHHARELFPCVDEPAAKATFDVTLVTEKEVEVISNTPVVSQEVDGNSLVTSFATTPKMSTYLLAFVIGELEYLEAFTKDGIRVRTYATPGQASHTQFALTTGVRALEFYNEYFGIPYPLEKCDMIGVPDFSAGAMENWGCVTYRESCFLVDEKNSDVSTKQFAAQVVIHELAHQWFGNLVTMQWWNDLWLNEGFARFMESFVADRLFPEWDLKTDFLATNVAVAQRLDALASTHPIQVEVNHPDEISTIFDAISYEKGAAALLMLHQYIGEDHFQEGLSLYLNRNKFENTVTDDLWHALGEASQKDVAGFMQQWVEQPGFPVVHVTARPHTLTLHQERFFANPRQKETKTIWPIPLLAPEETFPQLLTDASTDVALPTKPLFKLNRSQVGFYFTAYTQDQRRTLREAIIQGDISVGDRLGLLNEVFELARAGHVPTTEALHFLEAYEKEDNEHVWDVIAAQLGSIKLLIDQDKPVLDAINARIRRLIADQVTKLGIDTKVDESLRTRSLRQTIIAMAARAEEKTIVQEFLNRFKKAKQAEDLPADLRPSIYAVAARKGDVSVVQELLSRYRATQFSEERINLAAGSCASEDKEVFPILLDFMKNEVKSQDTPYWFVYLIRNPISRQITWQWTKDNWQWIKKTFGGDKSYDNFVKYSSQVFTTFEKLAEYKEFFADKKQDPSLHRAVAQGEERIDIAAQWRARDYAEISAYLLS